VLRGRGLRRRRLRMSRQSGRPRGGVPARGRRLALGWRRSATVIDAPGTRTPPPVRRCRSIASRCSFSALPCRHHLRMVWLTSFYGRLSLACNLRRRFFDRLVLAIDSESIRAASSALDRSLRSGRKPAVGGAKLHYHCVYRRSAKTEDWLLRFGGDPRTDRDLLAAGCCAPRGEAPRFHPHRSCFDGWMEKNGAEYRTRPP